MTRRVIARAKTARFIAVPVAMLGDPARDDRRSAGIVDPAKVVRVARANPEEPLTEDELAVLKLISKNPGK